MKCSRIRFLATGLVATYMAAAWFGEPCLGMVLEQRFGSLG